MCDTSSVSEKAERTVAAAIHCMTRPAAGVGHIHRVVEAIRKHVLVQKAITGLHISIPIDKPAGLRVVVSALEIIQPQIGIVVIPSVPYRVDVADERGAGLHNSRGVGHGKHLAPRVVGVFRHRVGVSVDDGLIPNYAVFAS